jgi:TonB-linked SusC/RagA family outer membrane protein
MKKNLFKIMAILVMLVSQAYAQDRTITGQVKSKEDGFPLPGVSVKLKSSKVGTTTGADGKYSLKIPAGQGSVLVFSFIGFNPIEKSVTGNSVDVMLSENANSLQEVAVVSAGGILRTPKEQGYAATRVTAEQLTSGKSTTVAGGLQAKVPGLQINATGSGANPAYRLVLRGNRSISGNNQALIVLDNVVVPNALLGNINPEDVEDIQVLNGASGAALYGSDASNGALIITTKKGKNGQTTVRVANTTTFESISFFPKLQNSFGSGSTSGAQVYDPIENQQYGPAFDGTTRNIGRTLVDGTIQSVPYSPTRDKYDFWDTGISNQTDFSLSSGDDKSSTFVSGQYVDGSGTTPKDKYNRTTLRFNGTRQLSNKFSATYSVSYIENKGDITSATSSVYNNLLNTPAQIPLLSYQNWQSDKWSMPDNYYNDYYQNPYFTIDNNRQKYKNRYLTGNAELRFKATDWLNFTYRAGITNRDYQAKNSNAGFNYTQYTNDNSSKLDFTPSVSDQMFNTTQFNTDFLANFQKDINDFSINFIAGASLKSTGSKTMNDSGSGLTVPGLYNLSVLTGTPSASESNSRTRQYGVWGDATFGYKKFLYLHVTGRNDYASVLPVQNRSFFYPAADLSFVATDALSFLKGSKVLDFLKIRTAVSKVGLINVDPYGTSAVFNASTGYGYGTGFSQSSTLVSNNLKPEITKSFEVGTDFRMYKGLIDGAVTYYKTNSTDQVISTQIPSSTGFTNLYINAGNLQNEGVESVLHITPIRSTDWNLRVGGNFTYNINKLTYLTDQLSRIAVQGSGSVIGVVGYAYPSIIGLDYQRDSEGRVIVNAATGNPTVNPTAQILGNVQPKARLGLDFTLRYKNLTLSALFEYRGGYKIYSPEGGTFDFSGSSARSAYYNREKFVFPNSSYLDPATNTYVANNSITVSDGGAGFWTSSSFNTNVTTNYLYSGDYWKLREASLAYRLPQSLLNKAKFIKAATVSVQGRNLFLWSTKSNEYSDPDYSANGSDSNAIGTTSLSLTPPTRYIGGTVAITF